MTGTAPAVARDGLFYLLGQEPDIEAPAKPGDGRQTVDVAAVTRSATTDTSAPSLMGASSLLAPFFRARSALQTRSTSVHRVI